MTTYPIALNVPYGGTISSITVQSNSGTGTFTLYIDAIPVTGIVGKSISSTDTQYTPTALNAFSVGQDIKADVTDLGSLSNVSFNLSIVRSIPATSCSTVTSATGEVLDGSKEENLIVPLLTNVTLYTITFATQKTDSSGVATTSYSVLPSNPVENIVDAISLNISGRVVGRASTGLTILLTGSPDSNNYVYRANVKVI